MTEELRYKVGVMPNPTATALRMEIRRRKDMFTERDRVMHQLRRRRLLRHQPQVPKSYQNIFGGEKAVKLPIMYRMVQTAVGAVSKRFPTIMVDPQSASDRKAAEDEGKGLSLLLQAIDNGSISPYLYGLYFTLMGDGLTVTKTVPQPWGGFPIQDDGESAAEYNNRVREFVAATPLPFYSRVVDPLTFYPTQTEFGSGITLESGWRNSRAVMRSLGLTVGVNNELIPQDLSRIPDSKPFPQDEPPPGLPPTMQVDEVWSGDSCAIIINGSDKVFTFENPLGEVPYSWGYADPTGVEDPTNIGMSVAFPLYYITPAIDYLVNVMMAWSVMAAPTPYTTQDPIPGVRPTTEMAVDVFEPGKMYNLPTGKKMGILQPPDVGREVLSALSFLVESSDRGGLPALVSGAGVGTRLPALTFQAAVENATDRLRPAVQSAEKVIASTLMKCRSIIARYDMPIKVNGWEYDTGGEQRTKSWATIKPTEARKGRRITVQLGVDSTQDLIAKGTHANFMKSARLWDREYAMRFSGINNPAETWQKIAADTIQDAYLMPLVQAVMQGDPDMAQYLAQQMMAAGGEGGSPPAASPPAGGPGRNRQGVPPGAGGGRRGAAPTQRPRGNRPGQVGQTFGRS